MFPLFLFSLFLFPFLLPTVVTLSQTPVPYGVFVGQAGRAYVSSSSYDIAIVRTHPQVIRRDLMSELADRLHDILVQEENHNPGDDNILPIYRRRFENLHWRRFKDSRRSKRWAPLEPLGSLVGSLLGLATSSEVDALRIKINEIVSAHNGQTAMVKDLIVVVNDTIHHNQELHYHVKQLERRAYDTRILMRELVGNITETEKQVVRVEVHNVIEAILSALEFWKTQEEIFDVKYTHTRDLTEVGHLTESLVPAPQLEDILSKVKSPLSVSFVYRHFSVRMLSLTEETYSYVLSLPCLEPEIFMSWHVFHVPFLVDSRVAIIQPEVSYVAIGHVSGAMIDARDCQYHDPLICPNVVRRQMPCVEGIITRDHNLLNECPVSTVNVTLPHIVKMAETTLLVTTSGEDITERCLNGSLASTTLPAGTFLVGTSRDCTISSSNAWTYAVGHVTTDLHEIADTSFLKGFSLNLTLPKEPAVHQVNWSHINEIRDFTYHELPRLRKFQVVSPLTAYDSYVAWISMIISIFSCLFLIGFVICKEGLPCLKNCTKQNPRLEIVHKSKVNPAFDPLDDDLSFTASLCKPETSSTPSSSSPSNPLPVSQTTPPSKQIPLAQCSTGVQMG